MSAELDTLMSVVMFFILILLVRFKLNGVTRADHNAKQERAPHDLSR